MSIDKIRNIGLDKLVTQVYDFDSLTTDELMCKFAQKINIIIEHLKYVDDRCYNSDKALELKLQYLLGQGLEEQVAKKLLELVDNGTLENIINETLLNNINSKVDNFKVELDNKIVETNNTINKIYEENLRIFKPIFGFNALGSASSDCRTFEEQKTMLDTMADIGVTHFPYCVNVAEDENGVMTLNEDRVLIQKCVDYCKEKGYSIPLIHVYVNQEYSTKSNFNSEYKRMINEIMSLFEDVNYTHFIVWNEATQRIKADLVKNTVLECFEIVRNRGKKAGIALMGLAPFGYLDKQLFEKSDFICFNYYQFISYKYDKTTIQDGKNSWCNGELIDFLVYAKNCYPNKEIIIGESGICGSYECLASPSVPPKDWQTYDTYNNPGRVCEIYYTGLFEALKNSNITSAYGWFPHDFVKYPEVMKKVCSKYFRGGR